MTTGITRRDFLNAALIGAGAALLQLPAPIRLFAQTNSWDGDGGLVDYAASHGTTENVVRYAHAMRDGRYDVIPSDADDTGEIFDLVIIGGGMSGLGAAFHFKKSMRKGQRCLIIENHPVFGGQSKRNEFIVNGQRLIGPQGANSFIVLDNPETHGYEIYSELGIPQRFKYQKLTSTDKKLYFDRTHYGFMLWYDDFPDNGYFFENAAGPKWAADMWGRNFEDTPFSENVKKDFVTWRNSRKRNYKGEDFRQWLDTMTYKEYLEKVMKLSPEITRFIDPVLASSIGLGSDAISAFGAYQVAMPGFQGFPSGFTKRARSEKSDWHSFPGGNDGFARFFTKALISDAISGSRSFEDIHNQKINFDALDRPSNSVGMRLGALAVNIEHNSEPDKSELVWVTYVKDGKIYRLKARSVVMANGSWVTRRIVKKLPEEHKEAYKQFHRSPMLVVNVAVTNWRFLYKLGLTSCRWFGGFGFSCNIRQPMIVGDYQPPLDPDKPAIITFYVPFYYPGLPIHEQGVKGRAELLSTSYADYEKKIKEQMTRLFGKSGFDPEKDIAGIILNRWGHAYVNPQPGFYFGRDGQPAPSSVIRKRFGRMAFGHSELNGHQHWLGAVEEGIRAARQAMGIL